MEAWSTRPRRAGRGRRGGALGRRTTCRRPRRRVAHPGRQRAAAHRGGAQHRRRPRRGEWGRMHARLPPCTQCRRRRAAVQLKSRTQQKSRGRQRVCLKRKRTRNVHEDINTNRPCAAPAAHKAGGTGPPTESPHAPRARAPPPRAAGARTHEADSAPSQKAARNRPPARPPACRLAHSAGGVQAPRWGPPCGGRCCIAFKVASGCSTHH